MKPLTSFTEFVLPHVPGCSDPLIAQAVRNAAIEFCQETHIVQEVSPQGISAGRAEYDVDVPAQMQLVMVMGIQHGDRLLQPVALRGLVDPTMPAGTPSHYAMETPSEPVFTVFPTPSNDVSGEFVVRASFAPTRTASQVHDDLLNNWAEVIASGALARLMSTPNQPYTSPMAASHQIAFGAGIARAKHVANTGRANASLRVRPRAFP